MKDYKRLTEICNDIIGDCNPCKTQKNALKEIITAIESGELCEREEVRKETARDILNDFMINISDYALIIDCAGFSNYMKNLVKKYYIEQVGNSDKLEDEE